MKIKAYAKINLGLNVKRRLENGYHDLEMIMVPINFYDELSIDINETMEFTSNKAYVKDNPDNTIFKAIDYLRDKYGFKENFKIHLHKSVPTRAGMAGGSSDGAMTIIALNSLLELNMTAEEKRQAAIAVGADVYFCLVGRPAKVLGIGDVVEPFECNLDFEILLVKPRKGVSTKESFQTLNLETCDHPDIDEIKYALETSDYDLFIKSIGNSLEDPSFNLVKEIKNVKDKLLDLGFDAALMSGSGSTVFGITKDKALAQSSMNKLKSMGYFTRRVKIVK